MPYFISKNITINFFLLQKDLYLDGLLDGKIRLMKLKKL
jgi:hypothetical protein